LSRRKIMRTVLVLVLVSLLTVALSAQSPNTAAITITAVDESGAVVPQAAVTVQNTTTGDMRTATTGSDGSIVVAALPISGSYHVTVAKPGFSENAIDQVVLKAGESTALRIKLAVAGAQNEIVVFDTIAGVSLSPELGTRLDSSHIDETPVL